MFKFYEKIDIYKKGSNTEKKFLKKFWGKVSIYIYEDYIKRESI
jgi:hypothetical protein